jgi:disintegrin and metalloproteinase domain-containing protein 17
MTDLKLFFSIIFRDFRLILTPKKGILHSKFKAFTVDGDGREKPVFVGKFYFVMYVMKHFAQIVS